MALENKYLTNELTQLKMKQNLKPVIEKARIFALSESQKYGTPTIEHINIANDVGQRLAKKLKADSEIVLLGTLFMDIKLGECLKEGKPERHIQRSASATKKFLEDEKIDTKTIEIIINCVLEHHGSKKFSSKESEIVANADCYRFLSTRGMFVAFDLFSRRFNDFNKAFDAMESKMNEKHKIISLNICKTETEKNHKNFKKILSQARKI